MPAPTKFGGSTSTAFRQTYTIDALTPAATDINVWRFTPAVSSCMHVLMQAVGFRADLVDRMYRSFTVSTDSSGNVTIVASDEVVSIVDQVQGEVDLYVDGSDIVMTATGPLTGGNEKWSIFIETLTTV